MKRRAKTSVTPPGPAPRQSCLKFFSKLLWIDGTPLLLHIERYRRKIFTDVLDTMERQGRERYSQALLGFDPPGPPGQIPQPPFRPSVDLAHRDSAASTDVIRLSGGLPEQKQAAKVAEEKKKAQDKVMKWGFGCLGVIVLLIVIGSLLPDTNEKSSTRVADAEINGQIAHSRIDVNTNQSRRAIADAISRRIYRVAIQHPEVSQVEVKVFWVSEEGFVDRYGNSAGRESNLGTIVYFETSIKDIPRYKDESYYVADNLAVMMSVMDLWLLHRGPLE